MKIYKNTIKLGDIEKLSDAVKIIQTDSKNLYNSSNLKIEAEDNDIRFYTKSNIKTEYLLKS